MKTVSLSHNSDRPCGELVLAQHDLCPYLATAKNNNNLHSRLAQRIGGRENTERVEVRQKERVEMMG